MAILGWLVAYNLFAPAQAVTVQAAVMLRSLVAMPVSAGVP